MVSGVKIALSWLCLLLMAVAVAAQGWGTYYPQDAYGGGQYGGQDMYGNAGGQYRGQDQYGRGERGRGRRGGGQNYNDGYGYPAGNGYAGSGYEGYPMSFNFGG